MIVDLVARGIGADTATDMSRLACVSFEREGASAKSREMVGEIMGVFKRKIKERERREGAG